MLKKIENMFGKKRASETEKREYIEYAQEFEQVLSILESHMHESDDSREIVLHTMKTACDFYDGDWTGFLEVDFGLGLWTPRIWYNAQTQGQSKTLLHEFESAECFHRWLDAMNGNKAIIIPDVERVKESEPLEYEFYKRQNCESYLISTTNRMH